MVVSLESVVAARPGWASQLLGGGLEGQDLQALLEVSRAVRQGARAPLIRAQEDRALLLIRGTAKAHLITGDGDEVITAIHGPGHAAGLLVVLGSSEAGTDLTSLEPVDALSITGPELRALLTSRPAIAAAFLRSVAALAAEAYGERTRFAGTCVSQRVAARLLELATRWGRAEGKRVHITLSLTQEELASWSGASRESVAKVLQGMRASGLLLTGRRSLTILDIDRLRARCEPTSQSQVGHLLASLA